MTDWSTLNQLQLQRINRWCGYQTGDAELADVLIKAAIGVCRHILRCDGQVFWEWPPSNELWARTDVRELAQRLGGHSVDISSAALGQRFRPKKHAPLKAITKKWIVMTNVADFIEAASPFTAVPALKRHEFCKCRGKIAKQSGSYPAKLATILWDVLRPTATADTWHTEPAAPAAPPIWSCMITRKVGMKSAEAKSEPALKSINKELKGHRDRGTWSEEHVREHRDLCRDPEIPEFMLGRVFGILGVKNAEDAETAEYKFRTVFQGSDVRTKTGVDAIDLYQEVSSSPVSFAAIRAVLAVACLLGLEVSVCDALQAYLQARIDHPDRVPTYVELPQDWWPDSWFIGGDRQRPKTRDRCVF